jgi:prepilin-type N-terminal cleavage/methylation domain-containing protein
MDTEQATRFLGVFRGTSTAEERTNMENHIEEKSSGKSDKGFTLVELLIVIVILGILATVTVFAVRGITDKGTKSACDSDKKTLEVGVESYFAQYGGTAIPISPAAVPAGATGTYTANGASPEDTLKNAGYLRDVSPKWILLADGTMTPQDAACGTVVTTVANN